MLCPKWCHIDFKKPLPKRKTQKRLSLALKNGKKEEELVWSIPKLPPWSAKKGPIDFIYNMWKSEKREIRSTLAIYPY